MNEEPRNSPVPLLIVATVIGAVLGKWWLGLVIGVGLTLIPGVALIGLLLNNIILWLAARLVMVVGFPFFVLYTGVRRLFGRAAPDED